MKKFDEVVAEKLAADTAFHDSIKDKTEEEKSPLIEAKRSEIREAEYAAIAAESKKQSEYAGNMKIRAEKAEKGENKVDADGLTPKDVYTLMSNKVPEEDVEDVVNYSKFAKLSIADAMKNPVVVTILANKAATRKTADATNTKQTRSTSKTDGNTIIATVKERGEEALPEKGSDDAEALFWARRKKTRPQA